MSVPSWAPVTLGFLAVLLIISCILCVCKKFIFKKKKEKGGKEKSEKEGINMSDVKEEGMKQVQTVRGKCNVCASDVILYLSHSDVPFAIS